MKRRGILHAWLTDAAIVDLAAADDVIEWLAVRWGIRARIKAQGMGAVFTTGTHIVGERRTQDLVRRNPNLLDIVPKTHDNLRRVPGEQLRRMRLEKIGA